ncbi:MAG: HAD-IC family P-type ATPase [Candidatus Paceibacterota bacterium]
MNENFKLILSILKKQVSSLFFILLVVSAFVSFFAGEKLDGIIIVVIILINTFLDLYQEFKASKATEKLLHLVQTKVYVFREGKLIQVNGNELVVGDIVHFIAGSIVPVDVSVIESVNAFVDDSVRTGETMSKEVKMGDNLFAGAIVSGGKIVAHVVALQADSSVAKYKEKLEEVKKWSSFNEFTEKVIKYIFIISLVTLLIAMFLLVFVLGKYDLAHFFVFAIAMLVGVVPEMLPLIITIILTRESVLLAKNKVIVKRLSSLESIGALRFLLTDKTGTITENKLRVSYVFDQSNFWEMSNSVSEGEYERTPLDIAYDGALNSSVGKIKTNPKKILDFTQFTHESGYEVFVLEGGVKVIRGILNKVLAECKNSKSVAGILESAHVYESKGMRVMGVAWSMGGVWEFAGFVAFYDPVKPSSLESFNLAKEKGIDVKILTGDSSEVAQSVIEELKIPCSRENIFSLDKIEVKDLTDEDLLKALVFAKCTPVNKLELMDRYIALGPVAFLGDGINDALALKRADIGIAVDNATDIAKESADIILLEKDLFPVLKSVDMGRKALRNILTYIMYTLAGNAGTFFSLIIASFFYPVLPMLPIQILLNNLLTDLPLMLIITDNPDKYALSHVPHFEPKKILKRVLAFGLISSMFDLFYFQMYKGAGVAEFQTGWFLFSVFAELALILSIRSSRPLWKSPPVSMPLTIGVVLAFIMPFVLIYQNGLASIFKFAPLSNNTLSVLLTMTLVYIFMNEILKYFLRKKNLYNKPENKINNSVI